MDGGYSIGIDLGVSHFRVGVWDGEDVKIVPDEFGMRVIPACVAFTSTGRIVGTAAAAMAQVVANPVNTIFGILQLVGRTYDDPVVQKVAARRQFRIERSEENRPQIALSGAVGNGNHGGVTLSPEQVLAMVLSHAKATAATYIGGGADVTVAVVTVPPTFNIAQRVAVRQACSIADLQIIDIANSPTFAAAGHAVHGLSLIHI